MTSSYKGLFELSVRDLSSLYETGAISPVEITKLTLERIGHFNSLVNAYVFLDEDGALSAARASEQRWRRGESRGFLDGVPVSIKDIMHVRGWPTRRGSKTTSDRPQSHDSPAPGRLREAGAVLLGMTNTAEFGWKGTTDNPLFGATANPYDPTTTAGGSSGGAGAAAALSLGWLHVGTDAGGSIRIPASFTGVFGMKPSFGRVPHFPMSTFGAIAHVGPMTRYVDDAKLMLDVLKLPDSRDWHALPFDDKQYAESVGTRIDSFKIAYCPGFGGAKADTEIEGVIAGAVNRFIQCGAQVETVGDMIGDVRPLFKTLWYAGAVNTLEKVSREKHSIVDPGLVALAEAGRALSLGDYLRAQDERRMLGERVNSLFDNYDLLMMPTEPIVAFDIESQTPEPDHENWIDFTPYTYPLNLTGHPAASINAGFSTSGMPIGLQIVGSQYGDLDVLDAASYFEQFAPRCSPPMAMNQDQAMSKTGRGPRPECDSNE